MALGRMRVLTASAAALLVTAAGTAVAMAGDDHGHQRQREAAALTGTAKLYRPLGDDITFSFDAHLAAKDNMHPEKAYGTFAFSHYLNGRGGWARGRVDCLMTGGSTAVMTGVVTGSDTPYKGRRVGITVTDDGKHDRLGYSWLSQDTEHLTVPRCLSTGPFETVKKGSGDFKVLPWHPVFPTE
ncbi:Repetin [Streptomyces carpinensis]|uniref:Repetin n=1 Tax=Streptomyces carpinensis TaxID=66369 RepID=A0ABV1W883_9ACTN|nr:Repetin [Streptomyces carpinensis]